MGMMAACGKNLPGVVTAEWETRLPPCHSAWSTRTRTRWTCKWLMLPKFFAISPPRSPNTGCAGQRPDALAKAPAERTSDGAPPPASKPSSGCTNLHCLRQGGKQCRVRRLKRIITLKTTLAIQSGHPAPRQQFDPQVVTAQQRISGAKLVRFEGVGHVPHLEAPQLFHAAVLGFLAGKQ